MTSILKICPRCSHQVPPKAAICSKCRRLFTDADDRAFQVGAARVAAQIERRHQAQLWGCGGLAVILVVGFVVSAAYHEATATPQQLRAEEIAKCFGEEGRNFDLVEKVKADLREPDSFQHIETRFVPASNGAIAVAEMRYRARNGFGGMNVASVQATVDPETCEATITGSSEN